MAVDYIAFDNVSFSYPLEATRVLNQFSFRIKEGDRAVFQGESGTGKTTIFRLLLGFEIPDRGNIFYKGNYLDKETIHEIRSQAAWLPQDLDLGSDTVETLINFPFQFQKNKTTRPDRKQFVETFERLGLPASSLQKEFADLSTGQRQRVGIAICYLLEKPLILLDEPTSALDSASKKKVTDLLFDDSERTILSTSHDPWWIERCNTIFDLNT